MNFPEVVQMLIVTTAHATKAEAVVLNENYARKDTGWLVHIGEVGDAVVSELPELNKGLTGVFEKARQLHCPYVLFDRDAEPLVGVPTYDW